MMGPSRWRVSILAGISLALSACSGIAVGSESSPSPSASPSGSPTPRVIAAPSTLVKPGILTFLSDTSYPPQESIDPSTNQPVGFDVDIASALAQKMDLQVHIVSTDFPMLIPALLAKKGDAIISAMNITPERQRQVAFVGYFLAGQSIMVRRGNPEGIMKLADLCGKTVAVQVTTAEVDTLTAENGGDCKDHHINIQTYPTDVDAVGKLKQGAADAAMDDSPVAAYLVKQQPNAFDLAGPPIQASPEGIAVDPKNAEVLKALQQAMLSIYEDGTYRQLLLKWNLLDDEVPASQIIPSPSPGG